MPRKRTPSPELTAQDKSIVSGAALTLRAVAERHHNEKLLLAAELADSFVDAPTATPKPRTRKPKAPPLAVPVDMMDALRRGLPATDA